MHMLATYDEWLDSYRDRYMHSKQDGWLSSQISTEQDVHLERDGLLDARSLADSMDNLP